MEPVKQVEQSFEQGLKKRPSFLAVVLMSVAAILVIFVVAIFVLHLDGGHLVPHGKTTHPTTSMLLPGSGTTA